MDVNKIDSSLQYGRVPSKGEYKFLFVIPLLTILYVLIIIGIIITVACGAMELEKDHIIALVLLSVIFVFANVAILYMIHYYKKLYKNIYLWLEDAVETTASVYRMDTVSTFYKPFQCEFSFNIDGIEHRKLNASDILVMGLNKRYVKYHNKTVQILYSPKYDQVLVLKD